MIILKGLTAFLTALIFVINSSGITQAVPYLAVIPDMHKLTVRLEDVSSATICVAFEPVE